MAVPQHFLGHDPKAFGKLVSVQRIGNQELQIWLFQFELLEDFAI